MVFGVHLAWAGFQLTHDKHWWHQHLTQLEITKSSRKIPAFSVVNHYFVGLYGNKSFVYDFCTRTPESSNENTAFIRYMVLIGRFMSTRTKLILKICLWSWALQSLNQGVWEVNVGYLTCYFDHIEYFIFDCCFISLNCM